MKLVKVLHWRLWPARDCCKPISDLVVLHVVLCYEHQHTGVALQNAAVTARNWIMKGRHYLCVYTTLMMPLTKADMITAALMMYLSSDLLDQCEAVFSSLRTL